SRHRRNPRFARQSFVQRADYVSLSAAHFNAPVKNVVLLGSTGSIGTSTVKVADDLPNKIRLLALGAGNNSELLLEQTRKHKPAAISIFDAKKAKELQNALGTSTQVFSGEEGLVKLA